MTTANLSLVRCVGVTALLNLALLTSNCGGGPTLPPSPQVHEAGPRFVYPVDGSDTVDPFTPLQWTGTEDATAVALSVGATPGGLEVYRESSLQNWVTGRVVWGLSPGHKYYARLRVNNHGRWSNYDISFATTRPRRRSPRTRDELYRTAERLTASVRLSTIGPTNIPAPGTWLAEDVAELGFSTAVCTNYADTLIRMFAQYGIYSRRVRLVIVDWITHVLVEYYDPFLRRWSVADPTFGLVYFDEAVRSGQSAAELSRYVVSEHFDRIKPRFVTRYGASFMHAYTLDPVTLFLNVVPEPEGVTDGAKNSPFQYLVPASSGVKGCYEFRVPDVSDSVTIDNPPTGHRAAGLFVLTPWDSSGWEPGICVNNGWSVVSEPNGTELYSYRRVLF